MVIPIRMCDSFFNPSLTIFYKDDIKDCPLTKVQQFSKFSLGEIGSQHLTTYSYIWN